MHNAAKILRGALVALLLATAFTPLIYVSTLPFPFVLGKMFFYRAAVEIAFVLAALLFLVEYARGAANAPDSLWSRLRARLTFFKDPLFLAITILVLSAAVSVALAPNAYRGFFGGGERGEGFLSVFHYFLFLALALLFFRVRDWVIFAGIWLGVAVAVMLYAWLQFLSITAFPFALNPQSQPGSWTGNPAYLAGYLIISLALVPFLYNRTLSRISRALLIGFSGAALLTVFVTGIRGAVLGVFAGVIALTVGFLFQQGVKRSLKIAALGSLAGLMALGGVFWMTRGAEAWQIFPGVRRLAKVDLLATPSAATRLLALKVSWEAFRERPMFGWGLENYNIAYNKYYDPAYAFYAEDWFDRAHNRFVDTAVTQGAFGLLAYLAVLGAMFFRFWKGAGRNYAFRASAPLLSAIIVAYVVQNLFIFDQITSYIAFSALAGFLIVRDAEAAEAVPPRMLPFSRPATLALSVVLLAGASASGYALYAYNYVPLVQAVQFNRVLSLKVGDKILAGADSFLTPYTFIQPALRAQLIEVLYNNNLITNKQFEPLANKALAAMEEVVEREPFEPRHYAALIESYNERAKQDPANFEKSEAFARKALALTPQRQGMRYYLSFVLAGEGRYDEALRVAKDTLAQDDRIAKAHYQLGLIYGLMADSSRYKGTADGALYRREAEQEMDAALALGRKQIGTLEDYAGSDLTNTQFYLFLESDLKNMAIFYRAWQEPRKVAEILEVLSLQYPANQDYIHDAIVVYRTLRNKEGIIRNAEKLKILQPSLTDSLDIIIDLAEKENWEILDTL